MVDVDHREWFLCIAMIFLGVGTVNRMRLLVCYVIDRLVTGYAVRIFRKTLSSKEFRVSGNGLFN